MNAIARKLCFALVGSAALVSASFASTGEIQGKAAAYKSLVEAIDDEGAALQLYRTLDKDLNKSQAAYVAAIEAMSPRRFDDVIKSVEDEEMAASLSKMPYEEARSAFLKQLDQDFLELRVCLVEALSEAQRETVVAEVKGVESEVAQPEVAQAFEAGKIPWWSGRAAAKAGEKVGDVGANVGYVVGPALGAVVSTGYIVVSTAVRAPIYFAVKFVSGIGKGFFFGWAKTRPVRKVIVKWAKAGYQFTAKHMKAAAESVKEGWKDVKKWIDARFGGGDGDNGDNGDGDNGGER